MEQSAVPNSAALQTLGDLRVEWKADVDKFERKLEALANQLKDAERSDVPMTFQEGSHNSQGLEQENERLLLKLDELRKRLGASEANLAKMQGQGIEDYSLVELNELEQQLSTSLHYVHKVRKAKYPPPERQHEADSRPTQSKEPRSRTTRSQKNPSSFGKRPRKDEGLESLSSQFLKRASSWWDSLFQEEPSSAEPADPQVAAISKRARVLALEVRQLCEKGKKQQGEEARKFLVENNQHFARLNEALMHEILALDALPKSEARKRAIEAIQGLLEEMENLRSKLIHSLPSSPFYVNKEGQWHEQPNNSG